MARPCIAGAAGRAPDAAAQAAAAAALTRSPRLPNRSQVIKVGTSSLIRADVGTLNLTSLAAIVEMVRDLKAQGFNVIIVSRWVGGQEVPPTGELLQLQLV